MVGKKKDIENLCNQPLEKVEPNQPLKNQPLEKVEPKYLNFCYTFQKSILKVYIK